MNLYVALLVNAISLNVDTGGIRTLAPGVREVAKKTKEKKLANENQVGKGYVYNLVTVHHM